MLQTDICGHIANELKVKPAQVGAAIRLLDESNTVPFIARYRKEATGELDEEQIRTIEERLSYLRGLVKRQEDILSVIEAQEKLTPALRTAIERTTKLQELEDLYLPYKPKKRTRAQIAREKGLQPLADEILAQNATEGTPLGRAAQFADEDKELTAESALAGALDIVAETIMERADIRAAIRRRLWQSGQISTDLTGDTEEGKAFLMYKERTEAVKTMPSHRILAVNRGEKKNLLKVRVETNHEANIEQILSQIVRAPSMFTESIKEAVADGYKRLLFPALEREIRAQLTQNAEKQAIRVFGMNLKQLLLQPPLAERTVLGLDPGYRTGCKLAVVDPTGAVLDHGVLYLTASDAQRKQAEQTALALIKKHNVSLVSIGNGTASYETEEFVAKLIEGHRLNLHYLIVNEAGASVYSASKLAKEELPGYDVTIRGAVSIARRVQDPLAELVKIDPKSIGVGQYQHDVNQKELSGALDQTIESAVNHVGVELNTASAALLRHISGISESIAKNIVAYRGEAGKIKTRKELLNVPRLGQAAFTQCAGFLRIAGGLSPLDNTPVHPESYKIAEEVLAELGFALADLTNKEKMKQLPGKIQAADPEALAQKLGAGAPTVRDILDALKKPGRDPREDLPAPLTRKSIMKLTDLAAGTTLRGTIQNVTDFGAFVDIGIKTAGLIHRSELSRTFFRHPLDVVSVGDIVDVMIISVDAERNRIALSLKQAAQAAKQN